ncbi:hypothetical protein RIF29_00321 [Crotalaria pallida]|uniref:GRF-type domain-containing protein n=1 Tax=Crotalaria pallida TaxID=3830 RepID=A0AAN9IVR2_CROPI
MPSTNDSCSSVSRKRCSRCGGVPILLTSYTSKNPGRMFWRCANWQEDPKSHYFKWVDDEMSNEPSHLIVVPIDECWGMNDPLIQVLGNEFQALLHEVGNEFEMVELNLQEYRP